MIIKTDKNNIYLYGRIWSGDETYFEYHFSNVETDYSNINVHVHTIGGDVFAGNYMNSRLKRSAATINMIVVGVAFSMGAYLLPSADKRSIVSNGFIMVHQAKGGAYGTAKDHRSAADLLDDMNENFIENLIKITGKSKKYVMKWFDGDTYFNAKKALKEGLVDEIIDPVLDIEVDETTAMQSEETFNQFAALLTHDNKSQNFNSKLDNSMKKEIIAKFGLVGVSAESSDTAVLEAMQKHLDSQTTGIQGKYDALKTDHDALKKQMEEGNEAKINALLKPLEGKLSKEKIDQYKAIGETSGVEALELALEGVTGRKTILDTITGKRSETPTDAKAGWDWDKYQKEDPQALERLAEDNPEAFNALYKAKFNKDYIK